MRPRRLRQSACSNASSPSAANQLAQRIGQRMAWQVAAQDLVEFSVGIDDVDEGAVVNRILAMTEAAQAVIYVKALGGFGRVQSVSPQSDESRIERLEVLSEHFRRIARGIERYEDGLKPVRCGTEIMQRSADLGEGRGTHIGTIRVAEIDKLPFAVKIEFGRLMAAKIAQSKMGINQGRGRKRPARNGADPNQQYEETCPAQPNCVRRDTHDFGRTRIVAIMPRSSWSRI